MNQSAVDLAILRALDFDPDSVSVGDTERWERAAEALGRKSRAGRFVGASNRDIEAAVKLLSGKHEPANGARLATKRLFDVCVALFLLIALAPLFLVATLQIKMYDHGPAFFRQTRVGRNGHTFVCLKFRTIRLDAEAILARFEAEQWDRDVLIKMNADPRITKPGRWLRRFSVDGLPKLVNVLRGDMSLVGPRAPLPVEIDRYRDFSALRLLVRPGVTGLWKLAGSSRFSDEEANRLDVYYVHNWSLLQDLLILFRTFSAALGSHEIR